MLVLSRQPEESIVIGDNIVVTVLNIKGGKIKLGITAPDETPVNRLELALSKGLTVPPIRRNPVK